MQIFIYIYIYIYICMCIYIYIYTHTHILIKLRILLHGVISCCWEFFRAHISMCAQTCLLTMPLTWRITHTISSKHTPHPTSIPHIIIFTAGRNKSNRGAIQSMAQTGNIWYHWLCQWVYVSVLFWVCAWQHVQHRVIESRVISHCEG